MNPQKYNKQKLIERIGKNRDDHARIYAKAVEGYLAKAGEMWDEIGNDLEAGKVPNFWAVAQLPVPENHTKDYNAVLDMLESSEGTLIELSEAEFRQYVRDEWRWKSEFVTTSSAYTVI